LGNFRVNLDKILRGLKTLFLPPMEQEKEGSNTAPKAKHDSMS
jgi:hypothetical protein